MFELGASHKTLSPKGMCGALTNFIRVRKSAIVNGACISEIRPMFDGVYDIVLAEGTVVTSSRRYAHKLRALLES
jgi:DNA-binding LytR/AlgR family response regulator